MTIRTILYGYTVKNGLTVIVTEEAETVKRVFELYINGETLNGIAELLKEQQVEYFNGGSGWNKGIINRMIENRHYLGDEKYPGIISPEMFDAAASKKASKCCKQKKQSDTVELLKTMCVCESCGGRYRRVNTWGNREKWSCANGCKTKRYIDDSVLETSIINVINNIKADPELINAECDSEYRPTNEVHFFNNEFSRLLEQPEVDFQTAATLIFHEATARFDCCHYASGEITDCLKQEISSREVLEQLPSDVLKKYIRKVKIAVDGTIKVVFINGAESILSEEE